MASIGLYFQGSQQNANELRAKLADVAKSLGYITGAQSPTKGEGSIVKMLMAIASGELILTKRGQDASNE